MFIALICSKTFYTEFVKLHFQLAGNISLRTPTPISANKSFLFLQPAPKDLFIYFFD